MLVALIYILLLRTRTSVLSTDPPQIKPEA